MYNVGISCRGDKSREPDLFLGGGTYQLETIDKRHPKENVWFTRLDPLHKIPTLYIIA